jgi:hypothetical protein
MQQRWATLALLSSLAAGTSQAAAPPKLVVVLVVDQLGANVLTRYRAHLKGGFHRLAKSGAYYPNGVHAIANSATAPGHANIATGAWPSVHGIVSNKWSDPTTGREVYCTEDAAMGMSPTNLVAPTIADAMKLATSGKSRVVTMAGKDRSAILLGGQRPDVAVWYDAGLGQYVTAKHQCGAVPSWLSSVNLEKSAAPVFGQRWERLRPKLDYSLIAGPDDSPFEEDVPGIGRTFPRTLGQGLPGPGAAWFEAYPYSPAAIDALFELAKLAIDAEQLGRDAAPDLLGIAISALDYVGHSYGLESQEAFDTLLRIDAGLAGLIAHVEAKLGGDATLWVLSADHGVAPTPERAEAESGFGQRLSKPELLAATDAALAASTGALATKLRVQLIYGPELFLSPGGSAEERLRVARLAAEALTAHPAIAEAHAHADIAHFTPEFRPYFERIVFPGRTADVFFRVSPGYVQSRQKHGQGAGSNHGTPYTYDTHVPIFLAGPGVRRGVDRQSVPVTRIAPSVTAILEIDPPAAALEAPLPATLSH